MIIVIIVVLRAHPIRYEKYSYVRLVIPWMLISKPIASNDKNSHDIDIYI